MSSSTAASGSKHARQDEGEVEGLAPAKKPRQQDDDGKETITPVCVCARGFSWSRIFLNVRMCFVCVCVCVCVCVMIL